MINDILHINNSWYDYKLSITAAGLIDVLPVTQARKIIKLMATMCLPEQLESNLAALENGYVALLDEYSEKSTTKATKNRVARMTKNYTEFSAALASAI